MKSYIFLIATLLTVAQVQATIIGKSIETHEQCASESKLTNKDIQDLFSLKVQDHVKCYLKCFLEKEGFWNNGAFDSQKAQSIVAQLPLADQFAQTVTQALSQCNSVQGSNDCDKAYNVAKCLVVNGLKVAGGVIGSLLKQK